MGSIPRPLGLWDGFGAGGLVPSHGVLEPPSVFAEVDVDAGFLGVPADARAPRNDTLESPITHEGSPGVTLTRQERGTCGGQGFTAHPKESPQIWGRFGAGLASPPTKNPTKEILSSPPR